jgi:PAS domain S-box-containing protein
MPWQGIDIWWAVVAGASGGLILVLSLAVMSVVHFRTRLRLQNEKIEAIIESEKKYTDLFNSVSDLVYSHTPEGVLREINDSCSRIVGAPAESLIDTPLSDYLPPSTRPQFQSYLSRLHEPNRATVGGMFLLRSASGARECRVLEYQSTPVFQDGRLVLVHGIARDVTEKLKGERSLQKAHRQTNRLLVESRQMQENLARLSRATIRMQEDERASISRELHDEIGQLMSTIGVSMQLIRRDVEKGAPPEKFQERLTMSKAAMDSVYGRMKHFLNDLRPAGLDDIGLGSALEKLLEEFSERTGIRVRYDQKEFTEVLNDEQKIVIFRIVQEALSNTAKYAEAGCVSVTIKEIDEYIDVVIADDGRGFDYDAYVKRLQDGSSVGGHHQLGLLGMQERIKLANGVCEISSVPGKGTTIRSRIPINHGKVVV